MEYTQNKNLDSAQCDVVALDFNSGFPQEKMSFMVALTLGCFGTENKSSDKKRKKNLLGVY